MSQENKSKPSGCPDHVAESPDQCVGPTNSTVCLEFCSKSENWLVTATRTDPDKVFEKVGLKGGSLGRAAAIEALKIAREKQQSS